MNTHDNLYSFLSEINIASPNLVVTTMRDFVIVLTVFVLLAVTNALLFVFKLHI